SKSRQYPCRELRHRCARDETEIIDVRYAVIRATERQAGDGEPGWSSEAVEGIACAVDFSDGTRRARERTIAKVCRNRDAAKIHPRTRIALNVARKQCKPDLRKASFTRRSSRDRTQRNCQGCGRRRLEVV